MNPHLESMDAWKNKIEMFRGTLQYREMARIDGESMEFEWKIFPRDYWSVLGLGSEKQWYRPHTCKLNGEWDDVAEHM